MECPRCGGGLEQYTFQGREAVTCESCGYIGVPVEHRGERREAESWADAISRFDVGHLESATVETSADPTPGIDASADDGTPEPLVVRLEGSVDADVEPSSVDTDANAEAPIADADASATPFVCDVCGKSFDARAQLYGHTAVHTADDETET